MSLKTDGAGGKTWWCAIAADRRRGCEGNDCRSRPACGRPSLSAVRIVVPRPVTALYAGGGGEGCPVRYRPEVGRAVVPPVELQAAALGPDHRVRVGRAKAVAAVAADRLLQVRAPAQPPGPAPALDLSVRVQQRNPVRHGRRPPVPVQLLHARSGRRTSLDDEHARPDPAARQPGQHGPEQAVRRPDQVRATPVPRYHAQVVHDQMVFLRETRENPSLCNAVSSLCARALVA